jgi:hypothetical protein
MMNQFHIVRGPQVRSFFTSLLTSTAVFIAVPNVRADLTLSLAAESADLSHLRVGQTVRFDVTLSGLSTGNQLDYLAGTILFDSGLLGSGSNVTAGAIIPDPTGFVSTGFSGSADAFYDAVFFSAMNTPISTNGIFYTFDVVTQKLGSGSLAFDLSTLAATDGNDGPISLNSGPSLPFTIEAPSSVPEPNSLSLAIALVFLAGCAATVARRRDCLHRGVN